MVVEVSAGSNGIDIEVSTRGTTRYRYQRIKVLIDDRMINSLRYS